MAKKKKGTAKASPTKTTSRKLLAAKVRKVSKRWHSTFLDALTRNPNACDAAITAGIAEKTAYDHRKRFPDFAAAWDDAKACGKEWLAERIEGGFLMRCFRGVTVKKFTAKGFPIIDPDTGKQYVETTHVETAVARALAALRPAMWSEKSQVQLSGSLRTMSPEEEREAYKVAMTGITSGIRKAALSGLPNLTGVPA